MATNEEAKQPGPASLPVSAEANSLEAPQAKEVRSRSSSQSFDAKKRASPAGSEERGNIENRSKGIKKHKKKHHKKQHKKHQR